MKKAFITLSIGIFSLLGSVGFAFAATPQNFGEVIKLFLDLVLIATPIVAGIALLAFFWGLANVIRKSDSAEGRAEGRQFMIWGIIGIFVMIAVWGLVAFVKHDLFGDTNVGIPRLPVNPTSSTR